VSLFVVSRDDNADLFHHRVLFHRFYYVAFGIRERDLLIRSVLAFRNPLLTPIGLLEEEADGAASDYSP
jgi:hypothetical protein